MDRMPKYGLFLFRMRNNKTGDVIHQIGTFYHREIIDKTLFNKFAKDNLIMKMEPDIEFVHLKEEEDIINALPYVERINDNFEGEHKHLFNKKIELQNQLDSLEFLNRLLFNNSKKAKLTV